ncbi:unnamed protein product [Citrullus colocynthis]|uniref:Transmembrane protein n=1 Tax=Citrullus colocynthis TaxID=252529 RepID=A0ABP0YAJ9_9ROSI
MNNIVEDLFRLLSLLFVHCIIASVTIEGLYLEAPDLFLPSKASTILDLSPLDWVPFLSQLCFSLYLIVFILLSESFLIWRPSSHWHCARRAVSCLSDDFSIC